MEQNDKASAFPGQSAELVGDGKTIIDKVKDQVLGTPGSREADDEMERPSEDRSPLT